MTYQDVRAKAMESYDSRKQGFRRGGGVHGDEAEDKALIRKMVEKNDLKPSARADGGTIEGRARGGRSDRPHGGKTVVNVIAPGGGGEQPPRPVPVPVPVRPPMAGGPGMPPGGPVAGMGPAPGMPPGMPPRARGGRMTGGAESGVGRLEKARNGTTGPMIMRE